MGNLFLLYYHNIILYLLLLDNREGQVSRDELTKEFRIPSELDRALELGQPFLIDTFLDFSRISRERTVDLE